MDIATMPLSEFLNDDGSVPPDTETHDTFELLAGAFVPAIGEKVLDLGQDYALHRHREYPTDFMLLHADEMIGIYCGEVLAIHGSHAGKGLATPLILAASKDRPPPSPRKLTKDGRKALTNAWKVAHGELEPLWPKP